MSRATPVGLPNEAHGGPAMRALYISAISIAACGVLAACSDTNNPTSLTEPAAPSLAVHSTGTTNVATAAGVVSNVSSSYAMLPGDTLQLQPSERDSAGVQVRAQYTTY